MKQVRQTFPFLVLMLFLSQVVLAQGNACLPPLHVDGKWIKDANGNQVTLHGVNIYLQGSDCLDTPQEMLDMIDHAVDPQGFGEAKVIRLALIRRFVGTDYAEVYRKYIRPAIDHCKKKKLYLIVYYHTFPNKHGNTFQDLIDFWEYTAPQVANDDNVLLACANEPVYSRDLAGFNIVRENMQRIVNTIRKSAKKQIIIAQGTSWTNYIAPYADNPLDDPAKSFNGGRNNIMYEAHIYPHNWSCQANGSQNKWDQMVGEVPDKFPVLIGEWSPISTNGCNTNQQAYFDNFVDWLGKKPNVSATAWNLGNCGDNHIMLNDDKSLNQWGQNWKNFVRQNTFRVGCGEVDDSLKLVTNLGTGNYLRLTPEDAGGDKTFVRATANSSTDLVQWQLSEAGSGYFRIHNPQQGGRYLFSSEEDAGSNRLKVYSAPASWAGDYTRWKLIDAGGGYYRLENKGTNYQLYCSQETSADGGYRIYAVPSSQASDFTKWKFEEVVEKTTYTLTASAGAGGIVSPLGETVVDSATSQTFTITPEAFRKIADVLVDDVSVGTLASYTFSNVTTDHSIAVSFEALPAQQAYQGPHTLPGTIEAEHYDTGGEGIAYHDDGNRTGDLTFRPGEKVDVGSKAAASNGYSVGWTAEGEWLEYTLSDVAAGTYDMILTYASGSNAPGDLRVTLDDVPVGTFTGLTNTGGWESFTTVRITNVNLTAGSDKVLRLTFVNGAGLDLDALAFVAATSLPQVGQTIWLRTKITEKYVYRSSTDGKLYAKGLVDIAEPKRAFQLLDAGGGYVYLQNPVSGQYVRALTFAGNQLDAQGGSDDKAKWKIKDAGNGYIVLENKYFAGQHMRSNENMASKSVDCYGGTGDWTQFSWGTSSMGAGARQMTQDTEKQKLTTSEESSDPPISVYPNPSSGVYQLKLGKSAKVRVMDMAGRVVYEHRHDSGISSLNISSLVTGLYVLVVENQQFKLIKE